MGPFDFPQEHRYPGVTDAGLEEEEEFRFPGATRDFLVVPMVRMRFAIEEKAADRVWEPRRPWHTGKDRRPAYWALVCVAPGSDHVGGDWHDTRFRTRKAACVKAQQLAQFNKARALISPKE